MSTLTLLVLLSWGAGLLCPAHAYNFTVGLTGIDYDGNPFSCQATVNETNPFTLIQGRYLMMRGADCRIEAGYKNSKPYSMYEYIGIAYSSWISTPVPQTEYYCHDIEEEHLWNCGGSNLVTTICGETFSRFYNLTGQDLTINETYIPPNTAATVDSPWYVTFSGGGTNNYALVSARTGQQLLYLTDNNETNTLCSADDIIVLRQAQTVSTNTATIKATMEGLLYGDIKSENNNKLLYAENESPIYVEPIPVSNIYLKTAWSFSTNYWGSAPSALINGETVCAAHSTTHIIEYQVNDESLKASSISGICSFSFTMTLIPSTGFDGGPCKMSCWDTAYKTYNDAPVRKRAEELTKKGSVTFTVTYDIFNDKWEVSLNK